VTVRIQDRALIVASHLAEARREWDRAPSAEAYRRFTTLLTRYEAIVMAYAEIAPKLDRHTE
jgi:hypothetical protein